MISVAICLAMIVGGYFMQRNTDDIEEKVGSPPDIYARYIYLRARKSGRLLVVLGVVLLVVLAIDR